MPAQVVPAQVLPAQVLAVSLNPAHTFSKVPQPRIELLAGLGVMGDAHCGHTVQHRYTRRKDPRQPNLTQVHLLHMELLTSLAEAGFPLHPGDLGENLTTLGIDLLGLPVQTRLFLGETAIVEVTGLRTPCVQMDRLHPGLMAAAFTRLPNGLKAPRAGVMAVVLEGGIVHPGCPIRIDLPPPPHRRLQCV